MSGRRPAAQLLAVISEHQLKNKSIDLALVYVYRANISSIMCVQCSWIYTSRFDRMMS